MTIEVVIVTDSIEKCIATNEIGSPRTVSDARAQLAHLVGAVADLQRQLAEAQDMMKSIEAHELMLLQQSAPNDACPRGHRMADWVVAPESEHTRTCDAVPCDRCAPYCRACRELDDAVSKATGEAYQRGRNEALRVNEAAILRDDCESMSITSPAPPAASQLRTGAK